MCTGSSYDLIIYANHDPQINVYLREITSVRSANAWRRRKTDNHKTVSQDNHKTEKPQNRQPQNSFSPSKYLRHHKKVSGKNSNIEALATKAPAAERRGN